MAKSTGGLQTGRDPRKDKKAGSNGDSPEERGFKWLKIEPGDYIDVVILCEADDIITGEQCAIWQDAGNSPVWIYTGDKDPYHELDVKDKRYRAFLPCVNVETDEVLVWGMGKLAHSQILDIADTSGSIKGMGVRIKRTGKGLQTRYAVISTGKRRNVSSYDEVDITSALGPLTVKGVRELIAEKLGFETYEDVVAAYIRTPKEEHQPPKKEKPEPKAKAKKAAPPPVEEEELEDLDIDDEEEDDA